MFSSLRVTRVQIKQWGSLYMTYLGANYISNVMIHPTAKLDYGAMNRVYLDNREVDKPFWGSRLPHMFIIPATLAFYSETLGFVFTRYLGMATFAATPSLSLVHLFVYTWCAVGTYFSIDAAFNPQHEGKRVEQVTSIVKPLTVGMSLQWHADLMRETFGTTRTGPLGILQNAFYVALIFLPVKALGFGDYGEGGLSQHERKMNGLPPSQDEKQ